MDNIYKTVLGYGEDEYIISKSRFIGYAKQVKTEEEALEFIDEISTKHHDATHNVYAYIIGQDALVQRFSDDGEPSGTAGIPMLEVLKKEGLVDVVVVGTRYFGGVKLGAGGLIRAYTKSAKIGIDAARVIDMVLHKKIEIRVEYTLYGSVENYLMNKKHIITDSVFDSAVSIDVYVENEDVENFMEVITNLTDGTAEFEEKNKRYIPMLNGRPAIKNIK